MNVFLWILQILLALHTLIGALWKISNPEQTVPSLAQIPHGAWLALSAFEILFSVGLVMPAIFTPMRILAPIAATCIAVEMLTFTLVASSSAQPDHAQMVYWLVVAAVCAVIAVTRFKQSAST